jgi:hypothetical protein
MQIHDLAISSEGGKDMASKGDLRGLATAQKAMEGHHKGKRSFGVALRRI